MNTFDTTRIKTHNTPNVPHARLLRITPYLQPLLMIFGLLGTPVGIFAVWSIGSKILEVTDWGTYELAPLPPLIQATMIGFVAILVLGVLSLIASYVIHKMDLEHLNDVYYYNVYQGQVRGHRAHDSNLQILVRGRTLQNEMASRWMNVNREQFTSLEVSEYVDLGLPNEIL